MKSPSYKVLPMLTEVVAPVTLKQDKVVASPPPVPEPPSASQAVEAASIWHALEPALTEAVRTQLRELEPQLVEQLGRALRPVLEAALARELQAMRKAHGETGKG